MAEVGQGSHDPIVSPARVLSGHTYDQGFAFTLNGRSARIGSALGSVELAGDQPAVPGHDRIGLGDAGHVLQPLRPSLLPISASADLSGSDSLRRAGRYDRKIRFSAAKYSFCGSNCWFTRPVT